MPALYGWEFLRADEGLVKDSADCPARDWSPEEETGADDHLGRIAELELQHGPYGAGLAEPLADLARLQSHRGRYDEAVRAYQRALHLVRINHGLHSDQQLAVLDELAETYRAMGDYPAVDQLQNQRYKVLGGGRSSDGEQNIAASLDYIQWQREAFGLQHDSSRRQRLLQAYLLNQGILDSSPAGVSDGARRRLIYSQLSNLYLIMGDRYLQAGSDKVGTATELHPGQATSPSYVRRRLAEIQLDGIQSGEILMFDLISLADPGDILATTALQLELGDWYQWNGETRRASRTYAAVGLALREAGQPQILQQWLGTPRELPDKPQFQQYSSAETGFQGEPVSVQFRVSARGQVNDVEIIEGSEKSPEQDARVMRMLAETHFRPRMVDGEAEMASNVRREYRLIANSGEASDECAGN